MARCARDVLSRDAPRETGCSRSADFCVLKRLRGTSSERIEFLCRLHEL